MDLLKLSTDWAKSEVFSAKMVWICGVLLFTAALGFWYFGKTDMAKAFVVPMIVSALLVAVIGGGLFYANKPRIQRFKQAYEADARMFAQQELKRTEQSAKELALVFRVLPLVLIASGLLILFLPSPFGRSIGISLALFTAFLMLLDSNTAARNTIYHEQLKKITNGY